MTGFNTSEVISRLQTIVAALSNSNAWTLRFFLPPSGQQDVGPDMSNFKEQKYKRLGEPHDALYKDGLRESQDPCVTWHHQCESRSDGTLFKGDKGHMRSHNCIVVLSYIIYWASFIETF